MTRKGSVATICAVGTNMLVSSVYLWYVLFLASLKISLQHKDKPIITKFRLIHSSGIKLETNTNLMLNRVIAIYYLQVWANRLPLYFHKYCASSLLHASHQPHCAQVYTIRLLLVPAAMACVPLSGIARHR